MTNAVWIATPSVRVNPSSQRALNGIDCSGSSWEFPTLEWSTPLRNSSTQRQLESLSPHGLGSLFRPAAAAPPSLSSVFLRPRHVRE